MSARTVVVAYNGGTSEGVAEKDCHKDEVDIHNDTICSNAIFASYLHKLKIIQNINNGCGKICHHF